MLAAVKFKFTFWVVLILISDIKQLFLHPMREVAFIKRNKDKWLAFEQAILGKIKMNPDDLAGLYVQLVNDLSFAQTYYPKSKTVIYLNHLAATAFQQIYKTKREESNKLIKFFKTLVYNQRKIT